MDINPNIVDIAIDPPEHDENPSEVAPLIPPVPVAPAAPVPVVPHPPVVPPPANTVTSPTVATTTSRTP